MSNPNTQVPAPSLKDKVLQAAKGFAGGAAGAIIGLLFTTVTDPDAALNPDAVDTGSNPVFQLPNTTAEWGTLAVAVLIGFLLPYLQKNFPSVAQALRQYEGAKQRVSEGKQSA